MSWVTAILQLYSQVADFFGNVIVKRINIILFDLLARFHYILNLPRIFIFLTILIYRNSQVSWREKKHTSSKDRPCNFWYVIKDTLRFKIKPIVFLLQLVTG